MGASSTPIRALVGIVGRELIRPTTYVMAALMGVAIQLIQGQPLFGSWAVFVVPVVVQVATRSVVQYRQRHLSRLLALPAEHESPAFVMDGQGRIVAAAGRTQELLRERGVTHLKELLGEDGAARLLGRIRHPAPNGNGNGEEALELYSEPMNVWYSVKTHAGHGGDWLVWLGDITDRHRLDDRLVAIRTFTARTLLQLKRQVRRPDPDKILAEPILSDGYGAVFVARREESGELAGRVFKLTGAEPTGRTIPGDKLVEHSDFIRIGAGAKVPLRHSQELERVVMDCASNHADVAAFNRAHAFDPRVQAFIGEPIRNFANYHEGNITVIAFNRAGCLRPVDRVAMEALVNTVHTVASLMDLAVSNDERFMQSITGVCAASEYSDELTGQHIRRVNEYSRLLARELGLPRDTVESMGQVAALHDIGKVAIPHIIKLERHLEPVEIAEMQMHTIYGAQIIDEMIASGTRRNQRLELGRNIALHHHQRWDGKGYPGLVDTAGEIVKLRSRRVEGYAGLKPLAGEQIPQAALIVSLADKYDALRSPRQYKPAFDHAKTVGILTEDDRTGASGEDVFGPEVFALFQRLHRRFADIYDRLSDGGAAT